MMRCAGRRSCHQLSVVEGRHRRPSSLIHQVESDLLFLSVSHVGRAGPDWGVGLKGRGAEVGG